RVAVRPVRALGGHHSRATRLVRGMAGGGLAAVPALGRPLPRPHGVRSVLARRRAPGGHLLSAVPLAVPRSTPHGCPPRAPPAGPAPGPSDAHRPRRRRPHLLRRAAARGWPGRDRRQARAPDHRRYHIVPNSRVRPAGGYRRADLAIVPGPSVGALGGRARGGGALARRARRAPARSRAPPGAPVRGEGALSGRGAAGGAEGG